MADIKSKDHAAPSPNGDPHAQVKGELSRELAKEQEKGARIVEFDEHMSPQEKAALAMKDAGKLAPVKRKKDEDKGPKEKEVATDIGGEDVPTTVGLEEVAATSRKEGQTGEAGPPGAMPIAGAPALPDWYRVGWTGVARDGLPKDVTEETVRQHYLLSEFISDSYYGYWWYNAAVIFFAVVASHFVTRFGGGWGWLLVILATCSTYYNTSLRRVRERARDDIRRELTKRSLETESETADWINNFMNRFWPIYEPVLSATVIASVDQVLATSTPAFLDSIRLSTFTLGNKAPRIEHVRTFPKTEDDIVQMDWKFSFTPNDIADMTKRDADKKINPKVVLTIRVGRGMVGAGMPILVEDMSFVGLIRIKLKLMTNFPHVQTVDVSFMEKPLFDYVLKPIGGETFGLDIANVPGLSAFIREQVHANLGPMMYDPNVFTLNLEQLLAGTPLDTACGVLKITIHHAQDLKGQKFGGGSPDPYVDISVNNRASLGVTKTKRSTNNPQWKETKFVLLDNLNDMLVLSVKDHNDHRPDTRLGEASFELKKLEEEPEQDMVESQVLHEGKERGDLFYSMSYYPVLLPKKLEDGTEEPLPETKTGICRLVVHQAKDLDKRQGFVGELNPYAKVLLRGKQVHKTKMMKRTNNPVFESNTEFLVTDRQKAVIGVELYYDRDLAKDPVIGYVSIGLDDLLKAKEKQQDWFPLSGSKEGRVRMSAEWKPVLMSGSINSSSAYTPAIGVVKFWIKRAVDVKNVEAMTGGKSDPYVQVKLGGQTIDRTTIQNNNLNPEWDEIIYCPVHSLKESITLEVMDFQNVTKDRSLGTVEEHVSDLARQEGDVRVPFESTGKQEKRVKISLGKAGYKGELVYDCQFLPAVALKDVSFDQDTNESEAKMEEVDDSGAGEDVDQNGNHSSPSDGSDEEKAKANGRTSQPTVQTSVDGEVKEKAGPDRAKPEKSKSMDTIDSAKTAAESTSAAADSSPGVLMSKEELLKQQSGIIVFNVLSGIIAHKNARLEVLFDDGYWPAYSTEKGRGHNCTWDEVGEAVVRELEFSRVFLRLNTGQPGESDDVFAQFMGDTKQFLERALDGPTEFKLASDTGTNASTVTIACKYIPCEVYIEPIESVNNQGILRVDLLDAKGLRAADRSGKSDPYAVFVLNGRKVFKSQVVKKTLNPTWNENFETDVPNRVKADFEIELFDWDQVGQPDKLGHVKLSLAELEPFEPFEQTARVIYKDKEAGEVRLRYVFRPEFVRSVRKGTSLGRTFTQGIGAGAGFVGQSVGAGAGLVGGAGKGVVKGVGTVGRGVGGVFGRIRSNHSSSHLENVPENMSATQVSSAAAVGGKPVTSVNGAMPAGASSTEKALPMDPTAASALGAEGSLMCTILGAKDVGGGEEHDVYIEAHVGKKEVAKTKVVKKTVAPEFNDTFSIKTAREPLVIKLGVFDHHTFGSDKNLGDADVNVWQHVMPLAPHPVTKTDVWIELSGHGSGQVHLRLEWSPPSNLSPSPSMGSQRDSPRRPSRFLQGRGN